VLDNDQLRRALETVRAQGWAMVDQELEVGLRSVAAPIARQGRVIAAINVSTSASGTSLEVLRESIVPHLLACASDLGQDLRHVVLDEL